MSLVRTPRRSRLLAAVALSTSLVLAGCGGDDPEEPAEEPEAQATEDATVMEAFSPLTGLPYSGDIPTNPVIGVKIDNSQASSPQIGLGSADLVVQELVEGGTTRLAVFFHQETPKEVGPVRSMRATDIGIVQPTEAVLVASGGAPQTVARVKKAGITTFTEGATGYYRAGAPRYAPYNLMMDLDQLAGSLDETEPPPPYLPFGDEASFPGGQPAKGFTTRFSGSSTTTWEYRGDRYLNVDTLAAKGDTFEPATVLVLRVRVGDAGYRDPAGNPVPETDFTGKGEALVFHGGKLVRGTWVKDGYDAPVTLQTRAGELTIPPGKVWIELVPAQGGDVEVRGR